MRAKVKEAADALAKNVVAVEPVPEEGKTEMEALYASPLVFKPTHTVEQELKDVATAVGVDLSIASFVRWQK